MPGTVSVQNAIGAPTIPPDADFGMCLIGFAPRSPLAAGLVSPPYSSAAAALSDFGNGDALDALVQSIAVRPTNPAPQGVSLYVTPATTPGSYGTINASGVTGTCLPANNAAIAPSGTLQPWMQVVTAFTVGVAGGTAWASLNGGRSKTLVSIGTSAEYNFPASDGWGAGGQAGFQFTASSGSLAALYTALNNLRTAEIAHFIITTGAPAVHLAADTTDNAALTAIAAASTPATAVTLFNSLHSLLATHGASTTYHTTADTVLAAALAGIPVAVSTEDCELYLVTLQNAYNAHRVLVGAGPVHGSADTTNTCATYAPPTAPAFNAGDTFYTSTLPPSWADADLYAVGPPATGAFAAIATSGNSYGLVVVTEPVAIGDVSTLVAGLTYLLVYNKRPALIVRFRDPTASETDAAYITAFQTFAQAAAAASGGFNITCCAGSGWLTDAATGRVYFRSGLPALLARIQSNVVRPGPYGERLAKSPGYGADGPLPDFTLLDSNMNPISQAHDEFTRGGIDGPLGAGTGGGITFCQQRAVGVAGCYVSEAPCMYGVGSTVLTLMDVRVSNGIQRELYAIAWTMIQGTSVVNGGLLDPDLADAMGQKMKATILAKFKSEIANPDDPNLVVVNPAVTVSGPNVSLTVAVNDRLFDYINGIAITLNNIRS